MHLLDNIFTYPLHRCHFLIFELFRETNKGRITTEIRCFPFNNPKLFYFDVIFNTVRRLFCIILSCCIVLEFHSLHKLYSYLVANNGDYILHATPTSAIYAPSELKYVHTRIVIYCVQTIEQVGIITVSRDFGLH